MFILRRQGGITAKELAKFCGAKCSKIPTAIPTNDFIISYGQKYSLANLNAKAEYNKLKVLEILKENEVLVPEFWLRSSKANIDVKKFPVLARKFYHSKGKDIIFVKNKEELSKLKDSEYDYLIKFIKNLKEYRVHIFDNGDCFISVKHNSKEDADHTIRSHDNGWIHIEYKGDFKDILTNLSKKIIKILEYNFAAIDIIRHKDTFYVLEVNSAPGLEPRKIELYGNYFKQKENEWKKKNVYIPDKILVNNKNEKIVERTIISKTPEQKMIKRKFIIYKEY